MLIRDVTGATAKVDSVNRSLKTYTSNFPLTAFGEVIVSQFTPMAGWAFNYNLNPQIVKTTTSNGGAVAIEESTAVMSTSVDPNGRAKVETVRAIRYQPGFGAKARFTHVFENHALSSQQIIGVGDDDDGFFMGYNGNTFGVMRRRGGEDSWTYIDDWSEEKSFLKLNPDNFVPSHGNVYQISYQWLGFGQISFFIENVRSGELELVHRIKYANTSDEVSVLNPTFPIMMEVKNTGNTTDIKGRSPSAIGGVEGVLDTKALVSTQGTSNTKSVTTLANVITISNPSTYKDKNNRMRAKMLLLSVSTDGNQSVSVRVIKNDTLTTPTYNNIGDGETTPLQVDIAGTLSSDGEVIMEFTLAKIDREVIYIPEEISSLHPGDTLTIAASSGVTNSVMASLTLATEL